MRQCVAELNKKRAQAGLDSVEIVSTAQAQARATAASQAAVAETLGTAALSLVPMLPGLNRIPYATHMASQFAGTAKAQTMLAAGRKNYVDEAETGVALQRCMSRKL